MDPPRERPARADRPVPTGMVLRTEGFEGPLDLLLELARDQKVDLARISVLDLADQYLAVVERLGRERSMRLEQAADWLVMAAWLTWLKSRLLLPQESAEAREAEKAARVLTDRLAELQRVRALAAWLEARPQLGRDVCLRGAPADLAVDVVAAEVPELLEACLAGLAPARRPRAALDAVYRPAPPPLWTVAQALDRLRALLGGTVPEGRTLLAFLPRLRDDLPGLALRRRAAVASTFLGALELAREDRISLRQEETFGDITVVPA